MNNDRPDPGPIMQLATGYWNAATLLAANELRLFDALADGPHNAAQIAEHLQTPLRSTEMLLDACAGLDLLLKYRASDREEEAWTYANTPSVAVFLVSGRPAYLGDAIRWSGDQYAAWGDLAHSVRANKPAVTPAAHLGGDPEETRRFVLGMHSRALSVARSVAHFLPFEHTKSLLDVGGGPGTYALLLAQKHPALRVTVLDLPGVIAVADELIAQSGLSDRVQTLPGDATTADYGQAQYDGVLFSGVLHQMDAPTIQALFGKAFRALRPGGILTVSDVMLDASKTQPAFATLFSLQMLLTSQAGGVFASDDCARWLTDAGFTDVHAQPLPPPLPYIVLTARKPE